MIYHKLDFIYKIQRRIIHSLLKCLMVYLSFDLNNRRLRRIGCGVDISIISTTDN